MTTFQLRWRPSWFAQAASVCAVLVIVAAVIIGRAELIAFAAPLLGALAGGWRHSPARRLRVGSTVSAKHCFEREPVTVKLRLSPDGPLDELRHDVVPSHDLAVDRDGAEWSVRPLRWGVRPLRVGVTGYTNSGLLVTHLDLSVGNLRVYPQPVPLHTTPRPTDLPHRIGGHLGRARGEGLEFAGIRPYLPGDRLRRVNWPATARRGRLHVTERLAERAAELVTVIDAYSDVPQPGASTLDLAVHGATDLVHAALREDDRVGLVVLGGILRWFGPDIGERQFYRIVDAVLDVRTDDIVLGADLDRIPRSALPPRAAVVVFSPLLDSRTLAALRDLRQRGCAVTVVDLLRTEPPVRRKDPVDDAALRMWRIERTGIALRLAELGIPMVHWGAGQWLEDVMRPLARMPSPNQRVMR